MYSYMQLLPLAAPRSPAAHSMREHARAFVACCWVHITDAALPCALPFHPRFHFARALSPLCRCLPCNVSTTGQSYHCPTTIDNRKSESTKNVCSLFPNPPASPAAGRVQVIHWFTSRVQLYSSTHHNCATCVVY
ncbi:hypothetical protein L210DRAFT_938762 [Boletus edulis BED1]|uniref:Uncharacterized protein n=1 Tax=Boletus edulis BED1 TaxID=1328754 RepID=A0AAD4C934_BOLED|nr:hypothetical protein L210DRAFT_938762 [Boletus edulis BED1]